MNTSTLACVIYDGINQAIFEGQILLPLIKRAREYATQKIFIISFESNSTDLLKKEIDTYQKKYPQLHFYVYKRSPFINAFLLWKEAYQLKRFLKKISAYTLIARGPFAAIIAKRGITPHCKSLIIQARGIATQEYSYSHKDIKGIRSLAYQARLHQLHLLEKQAYSQPKNKPFTFYIEVVSPALQEYLVLTYQTPIACCIQACFDLPETVSPEEKELRRTQERRRLAISLDATVYVYNGSIKPWQCAEQTVHSFKDRWKKDGNSIFLGITPDIKDIEHLLTKENIPSHAYRLVQLSHEKVMRTLCAADYGFLLREKHLMNWVSRPTKLLEYQAAGLEIIHNDTIALLQTITATIPSVIE